MNMKKTILISAFLLCIPPCPGLAQEQGTAAAARPSQETEYSSVEERRLLESLLQEQENSTSRKLEDLDYKKNELKSLEEDVDKKISQLQQLRDEIEKLLSQKDEAELKRVGELAKLFEKMAADKAAIVLANLNVDLAVAILSRMKTKSAARVLNNMDREKAAKLTDAFSTLN